MPKQRKTRKEKIRSVNRRRDEGTFQIKEEWLKTGTKRGNAVIVSDEPENKYLRLDLTKTFLLSMLVLALELAFWQYLSRH